MKYDSLTVHFQQRLMMKYSIDSSLVDIKTRKGLAKAIDIWYEGENYAVLVDERILGIIEWDILQNDELDEEKSLDNDDMKPGVLPKDIDLFYS